MKFLEKHPMYMIATGVVGISLSAIIVKYSDAPSLITAVYRLFFTVAMMTPVVFLNRRNSPAFLCERLFCALSAESFWRFTLSAGLNPWPTRP